MKNTFGTNISITLFGESHGELIGAVLDGIPGGVVVDMEYIRNKIALRKSSQSWSTERKEPDDVKIVSGVFEGKTTGSPITFILENKDVKSSDYILFKDRPRPGHSDYTNYIKYHGSNDYRGGGHSSGRLTAPLVAAAALVQSILEKKGILIGSHIVACGTLAEPTFSTKEDVLREEIHKVNQDFFPVLDEELRQLMIDYVCSVKQEKDSAGGVLETAVVGLEPGIGEPWFDTLEGVLAHGIFSIPGVKGVSFGRGFAFSSMLGSEVNDNFYIEDGKIRTRTNNNGGVNGGISNGMPIIINTAMKPTATIGQVQESIDLKTGEPVLVEGKGRHDPAIFARARAVVDSLVAFCLADMLCSRYGSEWLYQE